MFQYFSDIPIRVFLQVLINELECDLEKIVHVLAGARDCIVYVYVSPFEVRVLALFFFNASRVLKNPVDNNNNNNNLYFR
jgi:hypothetical protein